MPKREPTLQEALEGVETEVEPSFALPQGFESYESADIEAVLGLMGLNEADLLDSRLAKLVLQELSDSFSRSEEPDADEDAEEESKEEEASEETEENEERPKEEEKPAEKKEVPDYVRFAAPELEKLVSERWERSQNPEFNHPQMHAEFTGALANLLGGEPPTTETERVDLIDKTVRMFEFGAQSLMESVVPHLVHNHLQQQFAPFMAHYFSHILEAHLPGVTQSFHTDTAARTWNQIREESDQFADLPDFESKEFVELRDKIRAANPWIDNWDPDPKMPALQALKAKAQLFARLALGERVDPKRIQSQLMDALQTGKRSAEKSNRRVSAGRMLGRGKTTGTMAEQRERGSLMDAFNSRNNHDGGIA